MQILRRVGIPLVLAGILALPGCAHDQPVLPHQPTPTTASTAPDGDTATPTTIADPLPPAEARLARWIGHWCATQAPGVTPKRAIALMGKPTSTTTDHGDILLDWFDPEHVYFGLDFRIKTGHQVGSEVDYYDLTAAQEATAHCD